MTTSPVTPDHRPRWRKRVDRQFPPPRPQQTELRPRWAALQWRREFEGPSLWWLFGAGYQSLCVGAIVYASLAYGRVYTDGWELPFYGVLSTGQVVLAVCAGLLVFGLFPLAVGLIRGRVGLVARGCDMVGLGCALLTMAWLLSELLPSLGMRPGNLTGALASTQVTAIHDIAVVVAVNVGLLAGVTGQLVAGILTYVGCEPRQRRHDLPRHIASAFILALLTLGLVRTSFGHVPLGDELVQAATAGLRR